MEVELVLYLSTTIVVEPTLEISVNATAQKKIADEIENLEERYNIYIARMILNNYLLSCWTNSIATKVYRHPAWVAVAGVLHTDTQEHSNGHYCLVSVKYARLFASIFANMSIVISQDDKAKIGLGTACDLYMPQWPTGTSSYTHMQNLKSLMLDSQFNDILKFNEQIKPVWILIVDSGPDENFRYLKNIKSKYNPVKREIVILSEKLAGITLPINHFGKHSCNLIFGKYVYIQYVDTFTNPFGNLQFESTEKEKTEEIKR
ncbi:12007_t:CDS:2 [Gigaspora margarita]|uniref:12007_t:CDS:1 n=1 Tax=Gigaspora margarita TaxID=4874 RepID=A0ABN7VGC9_GIGMA|nr:12007_t:CDS:2 [Gigaspora margarita]